MSRTAACSRPPLDQFGATGSPLLTICPASEAEWWRRWQSARAAHSPLSTFQHRPLDSGRRSARVPRRHGCPPANRIYGAERPLRAHASRIFRGSEASLVWTGPLRTSGVCHFAALCAAGYLAAPVCRRWSRGLPADQAGCRLHWGRAGPTRYQFPAGPRPTLSRRSRPRQDPRSARAGRNRILGVSGSRLAPGRVGAEILMICGMLRTRGHQD